MERERVREIDMRGRERERERDRERETGTERTISVVNIIACDESIVHTLIF